MERSIVRDVVASPFRSVSTAGSCVRLPGGGRAWRRRAGEGRSGCVQRRPLEARLTVFGFCVVLTAQFECEIGEKHSTRPKTLPPGFPDHCYWSRRFLIEGSSFLNRVSYLPQFLSFRHAMMRLSLTSTKNPAEMTPPRITRFRV